MFDLTELVLGALVVVLAGAACALGGRVIRDAWRAGFRNPGHPGTGRHPPAAAQEPPGFDGPAGPPRRPDTRVQSRLPR